MRVLISYHHRAKKPLGGTLSETRVPRNVRIQVVDFVRRWLEKTEIRAALRHARCPKHQRPVSSNSTPSVIRSGRVPQNCVRRRLAREFPESL
jgi:hypothetical protein